MWFSCFSFRSFSKQRAVKILFTILALCFLFPKITHAAQEQIFPANLATFEWIDNTHYSPQQYVFKNTQCINTLTMIYRKGTIQSSVVISTSTVNPNPSGIWHGVVTSTGPTPTTQYTTFFATSTDSQICVTAGDTGRFIVPTSVYYYIAGSSSTYTNTSGWDKLGYSLDTYSLGTPQDGELWFDINGFSATGTQQSFINWYTTPTSTCDFLYWPVNGYLSPSDNFADPYFDQIGPAIGWSYNVDIDLYYDYTTSSVSYGTSSFYSSPTRVPPGIPKSHDLVPGVVYYAHPYILKNWGDIVSGRSIPLISLSNILTAGPTWTFILAGSAGENGCPAQKQTFPNFAWPFYVTSTPISPYESDWCVDINDSNLTGQVKKGFCEAAQYLFNPNSQTLDNFQQLQSQIQFKPPFGYVAAYKAQLETFANASSTTSTLLTTDWDFTDYIAGFLQVPIINFVFTFLVTIVYAAVAFTIFNRLRHFTL